MKNIVILITFVCLVSISCSFEGVELYKDQTTINLNWSIDDFGSNFAKAAFLTIRATADSLELAKNAGVDFEEIHRAVISTDTEVMFHDLEKYFTNRSRDVLTTRGNEFSLVQEISLISNRYQANIQELVPIPRYATLAADLITIEDGDILLVGGLRVPVNSLEGIATIEIMNRVADGEDIDMVIASVQDDIDKLIKLDGYAGRGVYMIPQNTLSVAGFFNGGRWPNGLVRYRFINEDEVYNDARKIIARNAMTEWQTKTGGKVKFEEITPNLWDHISAGLGQSHFVTFKLVNGQNNSTVGSVVGSRIHICPKESAPFPIYLHEIGHTLGLMHEHQRYDRDKHVTIASNKLSDNINYGIIPEKTLVASLKPVKIWGITIYLPYIWYIDYGKTVGNFDFDSIMIYDSDYGVNRKNPVGGSNYINYTNALSPIDIQTVRSMY